MGRPGHARTHGATRDGRPQQGHQSGAGLRSDRTSLLRAQCVLRQRHGDQAGTGGARDCADVQIGSGLGAWKNRKGWVDSGSSVGMETLAPGSKANDPPCVAQNGQCSTCGNFSDIGSGDTVSSTATLTNLGPATLQTSAQVSPNDAATAWEIDGTSAANRIAKQAIQAAKRRVTLFIPMPGLYQPAPCWKRRSRACRSSGTFLAVYCRVPGRTLEERGCKSRCELFARFKVKKSLCVPDTFLEDGVVSGLRNALKVASRQCLPHATKNAARPSVLAATRCAPGHHPHWRNCFPPVPPLRSGQSAQSIKLLK
jgi:hypothetical protein